MTEAANIFRSRRSIRKYTAEKIPSAGHKNVQAICERQMA